MSQSLRKSGLCRQGKTKLNKFELERRNPFVNQVFVVKSALAYSMLRECRNPFVNQVFVVGGDGQACKTVGTRRNPFVNQVFVV